MSTTWTKASIAYDMGNNTYKGGQLTRRFNQLQQNVSDEQIQHFGEILAEVSNGDIFLGATVTSHSEYVPPVSK